MVKDTDLLQAVKDQDVPNLERILMKIKGGGRSKLLSGSKKQPSINYQDEAGMSCLHQAAMQGSEECMQLLLTNGASSDIKDSKGMRPLHYAAWQGLHRPVSLLLQWNASANEPCSMGETPLHLACQHGHLDVAMELLNFKGDPTVLNRHDKTPLHLACEFGKRKAAQLLLSTGKCDHILKDITDISGDKTKTTCLHLASKNGHVTIIRLLLQAGVCVNRQTHQGTALHESALYGRLEAAQIIIENGVDVSVPNSYDQTALDTVNKLAKRSGSSELKTLLKEATQVVYARVLKDFDSSEAEKLSLRAGEYVTVVERKPEGQWKGFVLQNGKMSRSGFFPSACVTTVEKSVYDANTAAQNGLATPQPLSPTGAFFSGNFIPPPSPYRQGTDTSLVKAGTSSDQIHTEEDLFSGGGVYFAPPSPSYRTGSEMAAIPENFVSMVSPAPSSRNSVGSIDSRGGYRGGGGGVGPPSSHRLSSQSCESSVFSSRQSCHSNSSSSLQSIGREGGGIEMQPLLAPTTFNVRDLYERGFTEAQIIHQWLSSFKYEAYCEKFLISGYDMPTISRMTPGDMTAIGITKPAHRKHLKNEIARLSIHDGIPEYQPNSLQEWLHMLRLDEYYNVLSADYSSVSSITQMNFEDLESLGIKRLGHQKKLLLAVDKLKKLIRRQSSSSGHSQNSAGSSLPSTSHQMITSSSLPASRCWSADVSSFNPASANSPGSSSDLTPSSQRPYKSLSGDHLHFRGTGSGGAMTGSRDSSPGTFSSGGPSGRAASEYGGSGSGLARSHSHAASNGPTSVPDMVSIHVRNPLSRSSSGNSVNSNNTSVHSNDYPTSAASGMNTPLRTVEQVCERTGHRYATTSFSSTGSNGSNQNLLPHSASGNGTSNSGQYLAGDREGSYEDSMSTSSGGSLSRRSGSINGPGFMSSSSGSAGPATPVGPVRAIHGLPMSKRASQDIDDMTGRRFSSGSGDGTIAHYATLRKANVRANGRQFTTPQNDHAGYMSDTGAVTHLHQHQLNTSAASSGQPLGSPKQAASPFSNFVSPYAHIQIGAVAGKPVSTTVSPMAAEGVSMPTPQTKRPPAPPKRTNSMRVADLGLPKRHPSGSSSGSKEELERERKEKEEEVEALGLLDTSDLPPLPPPIEFNLNAMREYSLESPAKPSSTSAILSNVEKVRSARSPSPGTPSRRTPTRETSFRFESSPHRPSPHRIVVEAQIETNNNFNNKAVTPVNNRLEPHGTQVSNRPAIASKPPGIARSISMKKPNGIAMNGTGSTPIPFVKSNSVSAVPTASGSPLSSSPNIPPPMMTLSNVLDSKLAARRRVPGVDEPLLTMSPSNGKNPVDQRTVPVVHGKRTSAAPALVRKTSDNANTLPFANENFGTIKQRSASGGSGFEVVPGVARRPSQRRGGSTGESEDEGISSTDSIYDTDTVKRAPSKPVMHVQPVVNEKPGILPTPEITPNIECLSNEKHSLLADSGENDVLADIGSMLESLGSALEAEMSAVPSRRSPAVSPPKACWVAK